MDDDDDDDDEIEMLNLDVFSSLNLFLSVNIYY